MTRVVARLTELLQDPETRLDAASGFGFAGVTGNLIKLHVL